MRELLFVLLGVVLGAAATAGVLYARASALMVHERESSFSLEETVARLTKAAEAEGWKILDVRKLHESVRKGAGIEVRPVHVVDLCHPAHAGKVLAQDSARPVSVFMPCSVSVYEKTDGKAYVASTNAALLGRAFGGVVAEVMAGPVAEAQERFIAAATAK